MPAFPPDAATGRAVVLELELVGFSSPETCWRVPGAPGCGAELPSPPSQRPRVWFPRPDAASPEGSAPDGGDFRVEVV